MCGSRCTTASPAGRAAITWISTRHSVAKASTKRPSIFARNFIAPFLGFNRSVQFKKVLLPPADTCFDWRTPFSSTAVTRQHLGARLRTARDIADSTRPATSTGPLLQRKSGSLVDRDRQKAPCMLPLPPKPTPESAVANDVKAHVSH